MYSYLKGILVQAHHSYVLLEVHGIGYYLHTPCRLLGELPQLGVQVQFFTSFVIREAFQALYGFLCSKERDLFEGLINISGIGPKLALSLIGHLTFDQLTTAVGNQDLPTLCRVPGVGKKTAERLIVELKDKLPHLLPIQAANSLLDIAKPKHLQDAMLALINLGYNQNTAQKALRQTINELPETTDLALLITTALKNV